MQTVGIIGCGSLGSALAHGWRDHASILATRKSRLREVEHITWCQDNIELVGQARTIIVATKPKDVELVLEGISTHLSSEHTIISVAAGVDLLRLRRALGNATPVVRAMSNVAAKMNSAMTALSYEAQTTDAVKIESQQLFARLGRTRIVDESALDLYTALTGSGPAFVTVALEGFADGAVRAGLSRSAALEVAAQAFLGAANLIAHGMDPSTVRDAIATPAGCTVEGLAMLEAGAVRAHFSQAITETVKKLKNPSRS